MKLLSLARRKRHYQPDEKPRSLRPSRPEPVQPQSFRLLQLPPELRLIIYGYVFDDTEIRLAPDRGPDVRKEHQHARYDYIPLRLRKVGQQPPDLIGLGGVSNSSLPALLAVCRQVRRETLPLFHSHVTYVFPSTAAMIDVLCQWSEERLATVRFIRVKSTIAAIRAPADSKATPVTRWVDLDGSLELFPMLALDTLVVDDIRRDTFPRGAGPNHFETALQLPFRRHGASWEKCIFLSKWSDYLDRLDRGILHTDIERNETLQDRVILQGWFDAGPWYEWEQILKGPRRRQVRNPLLTDVVKPVPDEDRVEIEERYGSDLPFKSILVMQPKTLRSPLPTPGIENIGADAVGRTWFAVGEIERRDRFEWLWLPRNAHYPRGPSVKHSIPLDPQIWQPLRKAWMPLRRQEYAMGMEVATRGEGSSWLPVRMYD